MIVQAFGWGTWLLCLVIALKTGEGVWAIPGALAAIYAYLHLDPEEEK
jgi:hypothetical protein